MLHTLLAIAVSGALAATLIGLDVLRRARGSASRSFAQAALTAWGAANILFVIFLWFNHATFPLHLDLMEGTVLQHAERAARLAEVYPSPSPEYVPLAYNALYYYVAAPFIALFGPSLTVLRLVSIAGMLMCGFLIYRIVKRHTGSAWWGFIAAALAAAAYRAMDSHLDTAHSDSWFLCTALAGSYLLDVNRSRAWNIGGVLMLVASFWFKQHGALFALGGLAFLTLREGRQSWPYWLAAAIAGPAVYLLAGPRLFGSHFHYFTWTVPSAWSELHLSSLDRYARFIIKHYGVLVVASTILMVNALQRGIRHLGIWEVQLVFAVLSGLMGALDPGSSDNVFIAAGTWFIVVGSIALHRFADVSARSRSQFIQTGALFVSFGLLAYDPRTVIVSNRADASYADFLSMLNAVPGTVYAPSQGQLASGYHFYPAAHWIALEDLVRGPGRDARNQPLTRRLLEPVAHPDQAAYILTNYPLRDVNPVLDFLVSRYVLVNDFGDRFEPLESLPKRWNNGWPRYLYRYAPNGEFHNGKPEGSGQ